MNRILYYTRGFKTCIKCPVGRDVAISMGNWAVLRESHFGRLQNSPGFILWDPVDG